MLRAHRIRLESSSRLAAVLAPETKHAVSSARQASGGGLRGVTAVAADAAGPLEIEVNSSHHQSAEVPGDGLRVVARSTQDNIVEALEGTAPDQFVLAVQWHPERTVDADEPSRALFRALVEAATEWRRAQGAGSQQSATDGRNQF